MMAVKILFKQFLYIWFIVINQSSTNAFQCGVPHKVRGFVNGGEETKQNDHPW